MADTKELEKVRAFFIKDRYAADAGAVIEDFGEHYAKCSMKLDDRHKNAVGGIMGGAYFTLADFTFAVATNWNGEAVVSLNADISFIGTPKTECIIAETELIKDGRTVCSYNVKITDELGNPVSAVKFVGFKK